ncbi:MAG: EcsC family protein [Rhodothermales bacterium]|nr:EcsC family protein [Rhodothermales bacterium]
MKSLLLKPLYARAVAGLPVLGTPAETAGRHLGGPGTLHERAEELATTYTTLCASTGFVCGLGGFITMPITLPANLIGVALLQLHMSAATAFMGGHDPRDGDVRDRCIDCLLGTWEEGPVRTEAEEVVDRTAVKMAERGVRFLIEGTVGMAARTGKWVGQKLVLRQLPRRSLPLVGGVLGGASDFYGTKKVAETARRAFLDHPAEPGRLAEVASNGSAAAGDAPTDA